ncbi:hypothetical protein TanjilG_15372 [Lupinus angustifolius]|uniref:Uncharacterized protein n=1 Tax=Lupinus angustifolius TaxID=3871 RepID=A0A394DJY7_LUPAN|nr:hypothetical protein TanjilG_15372 [Lupinus angustifolius]
MEIIQHQNLMFSHHSIEEESTKPEKYPTIQSQTARNNTSKFYKQTESQKNNQPNEHAETYNNC